MYANPLGLMALFMFVKVDTSALGLPAKPFCCQFNRKSKSSPPALTLAAVAKVLLGKF